MLTVIALVISALAILTYLRLVMTGDSRPFNIVNACGWPIFVSSMVHHAYAAAVLNLFFIIVGTIGLIGAVRIKRAERGFAYVVQELKKIDDGKPDFNVNVSQNPRWN